jgi:ABC-2 type transport system ATP-binding protein
MYVRLGFSVAINVDPDILLVDEVLAVGDEQFQRRCNERFADLRAEGRTIVVVSHSLSTVQSVCDEVAWLDAGNLRETGPAGDVCAHYLGEVHEDRLSESHTTSSRWGSGEVRIDRFELLGPDGHPTREVHTGDAITVRCHFHATKAIERPVFFVGLHAIDGTHLTAPTSRDVGLIPDVIDGDGCVDMHVERLDLLPGSYDLSAAVSDETSMHVYDQRHRALRFDVQPGSPRESLGGIVTLHGRWEITSEPDSAPAR